MAVDVEEAADVARRAQALELAANRQRRRLGGLQAELGRARAARTRAHTRCEAHRRQVDAAATAMRAQRGRLDELCSRAFSGDGWVLNLGILDVLAGKHDASVKAQRQLDEALAQADAQIAAMRAEIATARARVETLADRVSRLRGLHAARTAERAEEDATEDAQARLHARVRGLS